MNSIWEGSGNVMCLDVMRAIAREPEAASVLLDELADAGSADAALGREIAALRSLLGTPPEQLEGMGRLLAQRLVLATQAALLRKTAPSPVADAFIATRARRGRVGARGRRLRRTARRHRGAAGAGASGLKAGAEGHRGRKLVVRYRRRIQPSDAMVWLPESRHAT